MKVERPRVKPIDRKFDKLTTTPSVHRVTHIVVLEESPCPRGQI